MGWVELRCAADEPVHSGLSAAGRRAVVETLAPVQVGTLATYFRLCDDDPTAISPLVELARDIGSPAIRIFPGRSAETSVELAAERLAAVAGLAGEVRLLPEAHRMLLRGKEIAGVLDRGGVGTAGASRGIM